MIRLAGICAASALLASSGPALAQTACLTDAVIDKALGDQVRAGSPFVITSALPDLPLCSSLTVAQAIQRIRAAAFPEELARVRAENAALIEREREVAPVQVPEPMPVAGMAQPLPPAHVAHFSAPVSASAHRPAVKKRPRAAAAPRHRSADVYFGTCGEARANGYSRMRRGEPGYADHLDRDQDGIACE